MAKMYGTAKELIEFIDKADYLSDFAKDDLDFMEWFGWHLNEKPDDNQKEKKGYSAKLVSRGCPMCNRKTDFLIKEGFCKCKMSVYEQRYIKRYKSKFDINLYGCRNFARHSWAAQVGNYLNLKRSMKRKHNIR